MFEEDAKGKHVPRATFMDLDPTTIDETTKGKLGSFLNQNYCLSSK